MLMGHNTVDNLISIDPATGLIIQASCTFHCMMTWEESLATATGRAITVLRGNMQGCQFAGGPCSLLAIPPWQQRLMMLSWKP